MSLEQSYLEHLTFDIEVEIFVYMTEILAKNLLKEDNFNTLKITVLDTFFSCFRQIRLSMRSSAYDSR